MLSGLRVLPPESTRKPGEPRVRLRPRDFSWTVKTRHGSSGPARPGPASHKPWRPVAGGPRSAPGPPSRVSREAGTPRGTVGPSWPYGSPTCRPACGRPVVTQAADGKDLVHMPPSRRTAGGLRRPAGGRLDVLPSRRPARRCGGEDARRRAGRTSRRPIICSTRPRPTSNCSAPALKSSPPNSSRRCSAMSTPRATAFRFRPT